MRDWLKVGGIFKYSNFEFIQTVLAEKVIINNILIAHNVISLNALAKINTI